MTRKEISRLVWLIGRSPIRLRRLYWRREMKAPSSEISPKDHARYMKTNRRFYGLADHDKKNIYLDLGLGLRTERAPLDHACQVLIHEGCHLAFNTPHVEKLEREAKRSARVWNAAERRLLSLLLPERLK